MKPIITCNFTGSKEEKHTTQIFETFDNCTCKGFEFRKNCKHVKKLKKFLLLKHNQI